MVSPVFFQFEADFVDSLRCIPMQVRYKLDSCGVKLTLPHWHQFSTAQRQALVALPCQTPAEISAYRNQVRQWVQDYTGEWPQDLVVEASPPWHQGNRIPPEVAAKALAGGACLTEAQWQTLSPLQRFALIKLSRPGHEHRNFAAALAEFGLL
ncbi:MAG TPA: nitrate reductase associated protein [Leptolyngbyaceae cyanobacterium M65_K2018_010]|nr:nitrate reductase associated protein [Leptolyngbyaceae cyanobacterium M65_K2018_010]